MRASADAILMLVFELAIENAELRAQLAEAQDMLVEMAVDAGELYVRIDELQTRLAEALAMIPQRRSATGS